jgi:hypothetical protein
MQRKRAGPVAAGRPEFNLYVTAAAGWLSRLDLLEVQASSLALIMGRELLKPAPGMLVLRLDCGDSTLFRLLMKESHLVHEAS